MGVWQELHGERVLFPILRPANSDLNLTIAMSLASVLLPIFRNHRHRF